LRGCWHCRMFVAITDARTLFVAVANMRESVVAVAGARDCYRNVLTIRHSPIIWTTLIAISYLNSCSMLLVFWTILIAIPSLALGILESYWVWVWDSTFYFR
jgi:hypothetical protein